jgi:hypothetical protein
VDLISQLLFSKDIAIKRHIGQQSGQVERSGI